MAGISTSSNMIRTGSVRCAVSIRRSRSESQSASSPATMLAVKPMRLRLFRKRGTDRPMNVMPAPPQFQRQGHERIEIAGRAERVNENFRHEPSVYPMRGRPKRHLGILPAR